MTIASLTRVDGLRAFRHRNYRLFYGGQLVSLIGTWMQSVAQSWLILSLTGDAIYLGLVVVAQFTPVLVLGLFGGLIADALPKRQTLIVTQTAMMLLAFTLFALTATGVVEVWMILVLALLLGTANAIDMPVRQAFSVEMVGREDVANAVALNSAMFNGARIVGPAVAGLTIAATSTAVAFLINGLSFLAVIGSLFMMRDAELVSRPIGQRPRSVREVRDALATGLDYVRRTPLVLLAVIVIGLVSAFGLNFNVLVPAYAKQSLGTGAEGFGFLMAAMGIGSLTAALWLAFGRGAHPLIIGTGALVLGLAEAALAATSTYGIALGLMFLAGAGAISMAATANTTIQITVPDELRGRVISVYTTVFAGASPIGGMIAGWIASTFGVDAAAAVGGSVSALVGGAALVWLLRSRAGARAMAERVTPRSLAGPAEPAPQAGRTAPIGAPVPPSMVGRPATAGAPDVVAPPDVVAVGDVAALPDVLPSLDPGPVDPVGRDRIAAAAADPR
jgi:MFS family permease